MKRLLNTLLVATCFGGLAANAATIAWNGGGGANKNLTLAANWTGGIVPLVSNGDEGTIGAVHITNNTATGGMKLVLTGTFWDQATTGGNGRDTDLTAGSSVTFNGGSFAARNATWRGSATAGQGIYTVNGLTLNLTADFRLIQSPSVVWNSGTATCVVFTDQGNGTLHFDFADGTISANGSGAFVLGTGSYINFTGAKTGSLIVRGFDYRSAFNTYIAAGKIKLNGSLAALSDFANFYDGVNTTLSIPTGVAPTVTLPGTNTFFVGHTLTLNASVLGSLPLTYQWYTNGVALPGATNNPVVYPNVQLSDTGSWGLVVTNSRGSASVTTAVVVVTAPTAITWDNGAGTTNIEDAANWNPDVLPNHDAGVPGLVATNGTLTNATVYISTPSGASDLVITFENGTVLQNRDLVDSRINHSTFVFNGASMLNTVVGRLTYFAGNTTMTFNNTASMNNSSRQYYFDGANNTLNFNDGSSATIGRDFGIISGSNNIVNWNSTNTLQLGATYGFAWDKGTSNTLNLSSGKVSAGSGGYALTAGNYFNFISGSTGVIEARGTNQVATLSGFIQAGLIRCGGAASPTSSFRVLYTNSVTTLSINAAPVAQNLTLGVSQGDSANMAIIGGKLAPTDADGDPLTVSAVNLVTPTNGGSVSIVGSTSVVYTASSSFHGTDSFTYTVSDPYGATDTKSVTVIVSAASTGANVNANSLLVSGGVATMQAFGIPGTYYHLQYTTSLTSPNWQDVTDSDVQASPSDGSLSLTDSGASGPSRYYRTRYVSGL